MKRLHLNLQNVKLCFRNSFGKLLLIVFLLPLLFISGCGSKEIAIPYDPAKGAPEDYEIKAPLTIALIPYIDKRAGIDSDKKIADISVPVIGISGGVLLIEEGVPSLVTRAIKEQLLYLGFNVEEVLGVTIDISRPQTITSKFHSDADLILGGEIKRFYLNVGNRDNIEIELDTFIRDRESGRLLWSGTAKEEGDRYAGTFGNTRDSIVEYIGTSLSRVVKKILQDSEPALSKYARRSYPVGALPSHPAFLDVPHISTSSEPPQDINEKSSKGTLVVTSVPSGAKFYIKDIYYGKTPITIDLAPGIYKITVKLRGSKDEEEKVAIRSGASTELEVFFED